MGVSDRADLLTAAASLPQSWGGDDWRIMHGDCLAILPRLPAASADLIFADPPYNLQLKGELYRPNMTRVAGVDDAWDQFSSFTAYDDFCRIWLLACRRILRDDGTMWVMGTYHNIGRIAAIMQDMGFWLLNDVIWHKTNPMPNFRGVRFTNATETLLWAKKSEKGKYTFNHHRMKADNGGKQMTNVWPIPICGGAERLRDDQGKKLHSTQKPLALLRRVILSSTKVGDVILDPFVGSGTTVVAARLLGRIGLGIDRDQNYVHAAENRARHVVAEVLPPDLDGQKPRRVPFVELLHCGLIHVGQWLHSKDGEVRAKVLDDGQIMVNGTINATGSIHRIGAKTAGTPSCNGWNFWRVEFGGDVKVLDELRQMVRKEEGA